MRREPRRHRQHAAAEATPPKAPGAGRHLHCRLLPWTQTRPLRARACTLPMADGLRLQPQATKRTRHARRSCRAVAADVCRHRHSSSKTRPRSARQRCVASFPSEEHRITSKDEHEQHRPRQPAPHSRGSLAQSSRFCSATCMTQPQALRGAERHAVVGTSRPRSSGTLSLAISRRPAGLERAHHSESVASGWRRTPVGGLHRRRQGRRRAAGACRRDRQRHRRRRRGRRDTCEACIRKRRQRLAGRDQPRCSESEARSRRRAVIDGGSPAPSMPPPRYWRTGARRCHRGLHHRSSKAIYRPRRRSAATLASAATRASRAAPATSRRAPSKQPLSRGAPIALDVRSPRRSKRRAQLDRCRLARLTVWTGVAAGRRFGKSQSACT